jgi:L-aspartate oxidase
MNYIYPKAGLVITLFEELKIDFERRSFGVIPTGKIRGGKVIIEKLQQNIHSLSTETEFIDFAKNEDEFNIILRRNNQNLTINSQNLVLATGGYAGKFQYHDNFPYANYSVFDMVKKNGGQLASLDCIFVHPFGYNKGRKILIGNESKNGEFIDSYGKPVFDEETRKLIKGNKYHEIFPHILLQAEECRKRGSPVFFVDAERKIEIVPTVHYTGGGIKTDCFAEAEGCKNLFAIGECRADGSRNGGRLPGYAFTAAIVYGKMLAERFASSATLKKDPA